MMPDTFDIIHADNGRVAIQDKCFQLLPLAESELSLGFMVDQAHTADALQLAKILEVSMDQGYVLEFD